MESRIYSHGKLVTWSDLHCRICGRFMKVTKGKQLSCPECRMESHRLSVKDWVKRNKERFKDYQRKWHREDYRKKVRI